jgi:hypothetical protein
MGFKYFLSNTQKFNYYKHLNNVKAMTINNINSAVAVAVTNSTSANKTAEDYFEDLEIIWLRDSKKTTFVDNVLIITLTLITVQSCYCVFKICFTPPHKSKPLLPAYKQREWIKRRSRHNKQKGAFQEIARIRHEKKI